MHHNTIITSIQKYPVTFWSLEKKKKKKTLNEELDI